MLGGRLRGSKHFGRAVSFVRSKRDEVQISRERNLVNLFTATQTQCGRETAQQKIDVAAERRGHGMQLCIRQRRVPELSAEQQCRRGVARSSGQPDSGGIRLCRMNSAP